MRDSCTHCTHTRPRNFGTTHNEKLEFVEHVLGTLIASRYGDENPYIGIGQPTVTAGHSQMFTNVRLLTAAEIAAHLEFGGASQGLFHRGFLRGLQLASANGFYGQDTAPAFWAKAREVLEMLIRRLKPTAIQRDQNHASPKPRGSPTLQARSYSRLPLRT